MRFGCARAVNRWFANNVLAASASPNEAGDKTGGINRFFDVAYKARLKAKELKAEPPPGVLRVEVDRHFGLIFMVFVSWL